MEIYNSDFITVSVLKEEHFLKATWKPASEKVDEDYFRKINLMYVDIFQKHSLRGIYIDIRDFYFSIHPDVQAWVASEIIPKLIDLGMKRIAFTVSKDFIAQLSVEQTMEENTEVPLQVFYFSEASEAERWLKKE